MWPLFCHLSREAGVRVYHAQDQNRKPQSQTVIQFPPPESSELIYSVQTIFIKQLQVPGTVASLVRNTGGDLEIDAGREGPLRPSACDWRWQVGSVGVASIRTSLMQRTGNPRQNALSNRKEMAWPWLVSSPQSVSLFSQLQNPLF